MLGHKNICPFISLEGYVRPSYLPVNVCTVFAYLHALCSRRHDTPSTRSVTLLQTKWEWTCYYGNIMCFCTVMFSHRWMRHELIWQRYIQTSINRLSSCCWLSSGLPVCVYVFWRRRGFGECLCREGGILCFQSYLAIASLSEIAYLAFKLWSLTWRDQHWLLRLQTWLATIVRAVVNQSNVGNHRCTVLSSWTYYQTMIGLLVPYTCRFNINVLVTIVNYWTLSL